MNGDSTEEEWRPKSNPWLIAVVVTLAAFMEILDTTIVNVSLPHIAGTLSISDDDATWTLTSYLVANGIVLTISGWFARLMGRKRYFLLCIGAFTVCSMLCGFADTLPQLIVARVLQGFFGGGLQPTQQAIIVDSFPPAQRGRAFALTAVATVVAPVLGPTLGGWITDNYSWRWIFFINLPVGTLALFAVMPLVQDPPWIKAEKHAHIDGIGLALIALGLGSLQLVMDRGEDADWFGSSFIRTFACLAAIGILGAIAWLLYTRRPVVNLRVFADTNFAICSILIAATFSTLYASAVVIPQLAQRVFGYTATLAGLILSPGAGFLTLLIPVVGRLQQITPLKYLIAIGFFVLGAAMLFSNRLTPDISFNWLAVMRVAQTAGLAFLFAPLSTVAFANMSREDTGDATALFTMLRNVSGSIGISFATAMITERTQARMAYLSDHLSPLDQGFSYTLEQYRQGLLSLGGHAAAQIGQSAMNLLYQTYLQQASVLAYADIFGYCAIMAFAVIPLTFFLSSCKGKTAAGI